MYKRQTIFCIDKVRFVGDKIAAVAAVDEETVYQALKLIKVDYEVLPAVFDPFEALKEGAPQIFAEYPGNVNTEIQDVYKRQIFISGFFCNALLAAAFTYLGDRLGLEIYYAAVFAFGVRIFQNLAVMRRHLLENWRSGKKRSI